MNFLAFVSTQGSVYFFALQTQGQIVVPVYHDPSNRLARAWRHRTRSAAVGRRRCFARGRHAFRAATRVASWLIAGLSPLLLAACSGATHLSFLNAQGPIAEAQRWHFYWVTAIMLVLVAGPIFILLPFWAWRYRYGGKKGKYMPNWEFSRLLEITAWGGPIIIVAILGFFVWRDTHKLDPYQPIASEQAPLKVQVIGYDWKWLFIYPDEGIATVGTLAMPVGRPVTLQLTSATVMQSFFIPALGSQIYAMGGMVSQLNLQASKPGLSMGENTMYNGDGFHQQKFTARAMSPADFKNWIASVHSHGKALDAPTLQTIGRQGTRKQLVAALPGASAADGSLQFTGVSKRLFAAVVKATMDGNSELSPDAFLHGGAIDGTRGTPVAPSTEQRR